MKYKHRKRNLYSRQFLTVVLVLGGVMPGGVSRCQVVSGCVAWEQTDLVWSYRVEGMFKQQVLLHLLKHLQVKIWSVFPLCPIASST